MSQFAQVLLRDFLGAALASLLVLLILVVWRSYRWIRPVRPRPESVYSFDLDWRSLKLLLGGLLVAAALIFVAGVLVGLRLRLPAAPPAQVAATWHGQLHGAERVESNSRSGPRVNRGA